MVQVKKLQRACLRNPVKVSQNAVVACHFSNEYVSLPFSYPFLLNVQIEAASKYSTVDTLKQQYRFVPAKHKVGAFSISHVRYNDTQSDM